MAHRIVTLPGDGIGPEIIAPGASRCSRRLGDFEFEEHLFGGASIDAHGTALTDEVLAACRGADAVLLAAVGGPKWDTTDPGAPRPEQGLLGLRKGLGLYANLRPVRPLAGALRRQPAAARAHRGHRPARRARAHRRHLLRREDRARRRRPSDLCAYTRRGDRAHRPRRVRRGRARKVTSVDKANVLETSRLWREVVTACTPRSSPTSSSSTCSSTTRAMQLVSAPRHFDVIVTENMFGDILTDEAAMLTGSIGMLPERLAGRARRTRPVRAGPRLGARHRRARGSPTRWRCSSRAR